MIIVDGPPAGATVEAELGGLMEIWAEGLGDTLSPGLMEDKGAASAVLAPDDGQICWFAIELMRGSVPAETSRALARAGFACNRTLSWATIAGPGGWCLCCPTTASRVSVSMCAIPTGVSVRQGPRLR